MQRMHEEEIWKPIPNYPRYQLSNLGRVQGPNKILKPTIDRDGYAQVGLYKNGKGKTHKIHVLMCIVYHPDTHFPGAYALHRNHVRWDNKEGNVYWGTQSQNMIDMVEAGRNTPGDKHWNSIMNWDKVRELRRRVAGGESATAVGKEFGITQPTASDIIRGVTWIEKESENDDGEEAN